MSSGEPPKGWRSRPRILVAAVALGALMVGGVVTAVVRASAGPEKPAAVEGLLSARSSEVAQEMAETALKRHRAAMAMGDPAARAKELERAVLVLDQATARYGDLEGAYNLQPVYRDYLAALLRVSETGAPAQRRQWLSLAQFAADRIAAPGERARVLMSVSRRQAALSDTPAALATAVAAYESARAVKPEARDRIVFALVAETARFDPRARRAAEVWAAEIDSPARRSDALSRIARSRLSAGEYRAVALRPFAGLRLQADYEARGRTLLALGEELRASGDWRAAQAAALAAPNAKGRDQLLASIAADAAATSEDIDVVVAPLAIQNRAKRDEALADVALGAIDKSSLAEARRMLARIEGAEPRLAVLTRLTAALADRGAGETKLRAQEALKLIDRGARESRDERLRTLATALVAAGEIPEAERAARRIRADGPRDAVRLAMAEAMVSKKDLAGATRQLRVVRSEAYASKARRLEAFVALQDDDPAAVARAAARIKSPGDRAWAQAMLARAQDDAGQKDAARALAARLSDQARRALAGKDGPAIAAAAVYAQAVVDQPKAAEPLVPLAISASGGDFDEALSELGAAYVRAGEAKTAEALSQWTVRDQQHAYVMRRIAEAIARQGDVAAAADYASQIPIARHRVKSLRAIAEISAHRLDAYEAFDTTSPPLRPDARAAQPRAPILRMVGFDIYEPANSELGERIPNLPDLKPYALDAFARSMPAPSPASERRVRVIPMSYNAYNTKFLSEVNLAFQNLGRQFFPEAVQGTRYPVYVHLEKGVYDLPSLARDLAAAGYDDVLIRDGRRYLLRLPLLVSPEATLVVTGADVEEFRLEQERGAFLVNAGRLWLQDADVVGWQSSRNAPAVLTYATREQFRPFVISWSGSVLNAAETEFRNLGFAGGKGYGLTYSRGPSRVLQSRPGGLARPTGRLIENSFSDMYFGFYSYEADDVVLLGNEFRNNIVYGVDPHDFSRRLLIAFNSAYGSALKHGIIASRGVQDSVILGNLSFRNAGSGLMLDRASVGNLIYANAIWSNAQDGVAVFESACNILAANDVRANGRDGLKIRNSWDIGVFRNALQTSNGAVVNIYSGDPNGPHARPRNVSKDPYSPYVAAAFVGNRLRHDGAAGVSAARLSYALFKDNAFEGRQAKLFNGDLDGVEGEIFRLSEEGVAVRTGCTTPKARSTCAFVRSGYLSGGAEDLPAARDGGRCGGDAAPASRIVEKVEPIGLRSSETRGFCAPRGPTGGKPAVGIGQVAENRCALQLQAAGG